MLKCRAIKNPIKQNGRGTHQDFSIFAQNTVRKFSLFLQKYLVCKMGQSETSSHYNSDSLVEEYLIKAFLFFIAENESCVAVISSGSNDLQMPSLAPSRYPPAISSSYLTSYYRGSSSIGYALLGEPTPGEACYYP